MNQFKKQLSLYSKPMLLGFLFYFGIMFLLTMIYATSQLEPLTGEWQVITNTEKVSKAFPISQILRNGEEITIKKTIALPPDRDFLTFSVYPTFQGELYINGHVIATIQPDEEMEKNPPPYIFLSYQIPEHLINDTIEIALKAKGPQGIYLGYPPILANASIIKQSIFRVNFVESYVFILAIGVQLVIVFLMFVIGNSMPALRNAYLNIGFGTLLQAVYLTMIVLAFNTTLFVNSLWYYYFVPLLMLASFIFLFQGMEFYILKRLRLTKYFWIGLPFILLFFILVPWSVNLKHRISIIYFLLMNTYMIVLSIKHTKIKLLQISLFILIFSYLSDFLFQNPLSRIPPSHHAAKRHDDHELCLWKFLHLSVHQTLSGRKKIENGIERILGRSTSGERGTGNILSRD